MQCLKRDFRGTGFLTWIQGLWVGCVQPVNPINLGRIQGVGISAFGNRWGEGLSFPQILETSVMVHARCQRHCVSGPQGVCEALSWCVCEVISEGDEHGSQCSESGRPVLPHVGGHHPAPQGLIEQKGKKGRLPPLWAELSSSCLGHQHTCSAQTWPYPSSPWPLKSCGPTPIITSSSAAVSLLLVLWRSLTDNRAP